MNHFFAVINYIDCNEDYHERFESLFATKAKANYLMPGFKSMNVLKSHGPGIPYLIVSYWENVATFKEWSSFPAFIEGHKRGFEDIRKAKEAGLPAPMTSTFKTYMIISD